MAEIDNEQVEPFINPITDENLNVVGGTTTRTDICAVIVDPTMKGKLEMGKGARGNKCTTPNEYEMMRESNIREKNAVLHSLNLEPILQSLRTTGATRTNGGPSSSQMSKNHTTTNCAATISPPTDAITRRPNLRSTTRNQNKNVGVVQEISTDRNEEPIQEENGAKHKKRKTRGHTRKENIWSRKNEPLIKITFNEFGQPIGKAAKEFSNIVGSLVRTKGFSLSHEDWRDVDSNVKIQLCDALACVYEMDAKLEEYALATAVKKWRDFKSDLKRTKFDENKTDEELIAARDSRVDKEEWIWLINYFRSEEAKARSARGKANHSKMVTPHTAGSKSFARVRQEWAEENGRNPHRHELFMVTRTRKDGVHLKQAENQIKTLQDIAEVYPELKEKKIHDGDLFSHVFGREHRGYVRSVGFGPTPSSLGIPGHRKYTSTKVQMALRGRRIAEQEVTLLKENMEHMQEEINELKQVKGEMQELKRMLFNSQGRRETTPNAESPLEHGSNPTPNRTIVGDDNISEDDEESDSEESNEIICRRAAVPVTMHKTMQEEGGKEVILLSLCGPKVAVAKATIQATDPKKRMGGVPLGYECYEVVVNSVLKKDALLLRPYGNIKTMADAFGHSIAWPSEQMMNNDKAARPTPRNLFVPGSSRT